MSRPREMVRQTDEETDRVLAKLEEKTARLEEAVARLSDALREIGERNR